MPPLPKSVGVSAALEAVIARSLAKDRDERQRDATEFARELREAMQTADAIPPTQSSAADVALNMELREAYPFCRLSGPANVLIMPTFHSASISTKLLEVLGGATVIGPILVGLDRPVQIAPLSANDAQLANMAALAAFNVSG